MLTARTLLIVSIMLIAFMVLAPIIWPAWMISVLDHVPAKYIATLSALAVFSIVAAVIHGRLFTRGPLNNIQHTQTVISFTVIATISAGKIPFPRFELSTLRGEEVYVLVDSSPPVDSPILIAFAVCFGVTALAFLAALNLWGVIKSKGTVY
jgi:hypothetical protein